MNSPTSPKPFPNKFKLITNSKNVLYWFVVVDKRHAHPGKIKLHHNRPNSLANGAHAASEFRKQRLTFLSINIITKYFALPCSPENNEKYIVPRCYSTILQQIQSCAQRRHCCNQIPHAISSCQGERSTCSPYQREFILPYFAGGPGC